MSKINNNLLKAKKLKNDEFYTLYEDIEKELCHYKKHFKGKVVYCNCDTENSNFVKYFKNNFDELQLKELIYTSYDFRSPQAIEILKKADIICTNPPFSLFREYITQLIKYNKKFLIIGNFNAVTYREIFPLIKDNKIWLGVSPRSMTFILPDGSSTQTNACWYTNLPHKKRNEKLILYKKYHGHEDEYPKYDNYDAIEVSKVANIPIDYEGTMGVPITFLEKYNPEQFEIIGIDRVLTKETANKVTRFYINNKEIYARILIKKKEK